jgi:hypothetical protein
MDWRSRRVENFLQAVHVAKEQPVLRCSISPERTQPATTRISLASQGRSIEKSNDLRVEHFKPWQFSNEMQFCCPGANRQAGQKRKHGRC